MKSKTITVAISYSRQMPTTKERTVHLLSQLEEVNGLSNLSVMRDPSIILRRLYDEKVHPVIEKNTSQEFFHVF